MATRTIESPGVEIRETDLSQTAQLPVGTSVFVAGFAAQGPTDEITSVTSISEFENIFGLPTNPAERYFYHASRQILTQSNAQLNVARLPYGPGLGEGFSNACTALLYPVIPVTTSTVSAGAISASDVSAASAYYFGAPTHAYLTQAQRDGVVAGGTQWAETIDARDPIDNLELGRAGIIILNDVKSTIDDRFQGYYVTISDNSILNPVTTETYDAAADVFTQVGNSIFIPVASSRYNFTLTSPVSSSIKSISQTIEGIPGFDMGNPNFKDCVIVSVYKLRNTPYGKDTTVLDAVLDEAFYGSLNYDRKIQDPNGGAAKTFFIESQVNENSRNIKLYVNSNISQAGNWTTVSSSAPQKTVRVLRPSTRAEFASTYGIAASAIPLANANALFAVGAYAAVATEYKVIGDLPGKLDRVLERLENTDLYKLDISIDAGLSTIWAQSQVSATLIYAPQSDDQGVIGGTPPNGVTPTSNPESFSYEFDDTISVSLSADGLYAQDGNPTSPGNIAGAWAVITSKLDNFAKEIRRDHIFISDPLRWILVQGKDLKVEKNKVEGETFQFGKHVYWAMKNLYGGVNSSYSAAYANFVKFYDNNTASFFWMPFSSVAAAMFARVDRDQFPWIAPAGLSRGILSGVLDVAINPTQKQRDFLYRINMNPVVYFPNSGFTVWGQKTMLKTPSAFDRINVRRMFLWVEKGVLDATKYFVFEPNTMFTRKRLNNTIDPIFQYVKNTDGVYDYMIVCDDRNNTSDVIDRNELKVDIYIKPVRAAEFILVNFYATKTSQNFAELI